MEYNIQLSDEKLLSFNDTTGDIVLKAEDLPNNIQLNDVVEIQYTEDSENVKHEYIIKNIDEDVVYLSWNKQIGESLQEARVVFNADDLNNPSQINMKDKIATAMEDERLAKEQEARRAEEQKLKEKNEHIVEKLEDSYLKSLQTENILEMLFDELVPPSGAAESVAGELVRAIMRILFRDYNDGDKFFSGYGIETCGSSAEYLRDNGFSEEVENIVDDSFRLMDDDEKYTARIMSLSKSVIDSIHTNSELLWTINDVDSRDYSTDYIEENQPRYDYELYASDAVADLVENGTLDAWDLNRYVEAQMEYDSSYNGAVVDAPWSHDSTTVSVSELTYDGYEHLKNMFEHDVDGFWADLVSDYTDADELDDDYNVED